MCRPPLLLCLLTLGTAPKSTNTGKVKKEETFHLTFINKVNENILLLAVQLANTLRYRWEYQVQTIDAFVRVQNWWFSSLCREHTVHTHWCMNTNITPPKGFRVKISNFGISYYLFFLGGLRKIKSTET